MHQRSELSHGYSRDIYHGRGGPGGSYGTHDYGYDAGNYYPEGHPPREASYEYGPSGTYGTPYDGPTAEENAIRTIPPWSVPGPETGRGPKGYRRSDERIHEDVCERMTAHGGLDAREIELSVETGEVTLEGTVGDRRAKRLAEDLAISVSGVEDVHNRLRLERHVHREGDGSAESAEAAH